MEQEQNILYRDIYRAKQLPLLDESFTGTYGQQEQVRKVTKRLPEGQIIRQTRKIVLPAGLPPDIPLAPEITFESELEDSEKTVTVFDAQIHHS